MRKLSLSERRALRRLSSRVDSAGPAHGPRGQVRRLRTGACMKKGTSSALLACVLLGGCMADLGGPYHGTSGYAERREGVYGIDISVWSGTVTDTEMDCFWDEGVRHVIVGMQDYRIARQQLDMALSRGMTVDAYVYLMWDGDVTRQVRDAVALLAEYPVGMIWLDVEEAPAGRGRRELERLVSDALAACGDAACGIYTAAWWWTPHMGGSSAFADVPLWYALYDGNPSLETWSRDAFGGWREVWGKQYAGDLYLCGIDVDLNTIAVTTSPSVAHPAPRPAPAGAPEVPTGLDPDGSRVPTWQDVRMISAAAPGATRYEFAIESWNGSSWRAYHTYATTTNARQFSPGFRNAAYRFRVRAGNASGWSAWSPYARFDYGTVSSPPPAETPTEPPPSEPPPSEPPPSEPPPSEPPPSEPPPPTADGLSPADGSLVTTSSVTLSRTPISGATRYEHEIEYWNGAAFAHYYTYSGTTPSRTFWPAYRDTSYRWRVRATTSAGTLAWSPRVSFRFGAGAESPTEPTPPPSEPPPPEEPPPPPPEEPAVPGAPTGLTPNGGSLSTASVTLRCDPVDGATSYEIAIEYIVSGSYRSYYTYTTSVPSKSFYPATRGTTYRWRVRARTAAGLGPYSSYASFDYL